ncbi:transcription factor cwo isoform X2 [Choristoneura fumiferana]|uniref:transcription factor cwo isoform X2 n=1 Tax=Choristoneura fumiferana TaxID=7141 RepID=UPI003D15BD01
METRHYWAENGHAVKYENFNSTEEFRAAEELGFVVPSEDEDYQTGFLKKGKQDPMSHRIIEKRRRDRMNNCLADLSRLIPPEYLKKGRGRVEKTEIIEMAIRHLKFLQERANAAERATGDEFRAGFQEALAEAARFLEMQGYGPGDGFCAQLAAHLQRHVELIAKGEAPQREGSRLHQGLSSETTSSSSSSQGYAANGMAARRPEPLPALEPYAPASEPYPMESDKVPNGPIVGPEEPPQDNEPLNLDGRRKCEPTLRAIRKPDHSEDYLHSYKFKNSIERRFSKSQDCEAADMSHNPCKPNAHKRRRAVKPASSTSNSGSGSGSTSQSGCNSHSGSTSQSGSNSNEDARDTSPQDTSSESPHQHYDKPLASPAQFVPVFALSSLGKYYVPLSVDYACLARHLSPHDALESRATLVTAPLHPVTIHVNFQPCFDHHQVKRETNDRDWRPV